MKNLKDLTHLKASENSLVIELPFCGFYSLGFVPEFTPAGWVSKVALQINSAFVTTSEVVYRLGGVDPKDVVCDRGYFGRVGDMAGTGRCSPCASGTFASSINSSACTVCPAGKSSVVAMSSTEDDCELCPAGKFSGPDDKSCLECGKGTANKQKGGVASNNCTQCDVGLYAPDTGMSRW